AAVLVAVVLVAVVLAAPDLAGFVAAVFVALPEVLGFVPPDFFAEVLAVAPLVVAGADCADSSCPVASLCSSVVAAAFAADFFFAGDAAFLPVVFVFVVDVIFSPSSIVRVVPRARKHWLPHVPEARSL